MGSKPFCIAARSGNAKLPVNGIKKWHSILYHYKKKNADVIII